MILFECEDRRLVDVEYTQRFAQQGVILQLQGRFFVMVDVIKDIVEVTTLLLEVLVGCPTDFGKLWETSD